MNKPYYIYPLGDRAVTVHFEDVIDEHINQNVLRLADSLWSKSLEGILDIIPAYASLTVVYDPLLIKQKTPGTINDFIMGQINSILNDRDNNIPPASRKIVIPVCYDLSVAPDLEAMAAEKNMSVKAIISMHSAVTYRVYMTGFLPGFAYMGTVHKQIATPRKAIPRQRVPAGSVGIAGAQTGIYPLNSPGGWNIIGQTPLNIFDKTKATPCLLQPGDEVVFEQISREEFEHIKQQQ